jgi:hypothetical protein
MVISKQETTLFCTNCGNRIYAETSLQVDRTTVKISPAVLIAMHTTLVCRECGTVFTEEDDSE